MHIPEWIEPDLVRMIGPGVVRRALDDALAAGAFELNIGYYHAWLTEAAAIDGNDDEVIEQGGLALAELPRQEALLRARVQARMGDAYWELGEFEPALENFAAAHGGDPGITRRLGIALPVSLRTSGGGLSRELADVLRASPRFREHDNGLLLEAGDNGAACLRTRSGASLACYTLAAGSVGSVGAAGTAGEASKAFHARAFGPGLDISMAQRSILRGSSVILANSARSGGASTELLLGN